MRCNPSGSRPLAFAALALVLSACNGNNIPAANGVTQRRARPAGIPSGAAARQRAGRAVSSPSFGQRQDPARHHHRSRESVF